jgi:peptidoglycan/LPS O-acetylase OafA/YrhL
MLVGPSGRGPGRSSTKTDSLPALTGIRGLAAWWVVLYHFRDHYPDDPLHIVSRVMAHGYLAVDFFFELSGFILALNYLAAFRTVNSRDVLHFLGLRLARIYPLHIFMLALFLLNPLAILLGSTSATLTTRYDPGYFLLSVVLMQNWGFTRELAWNVPAWSISTEWLAYMFFPMFAWFLLRTAPTSRRAAAAALGALLVLALSLAAMHDTLGEDIARNGLVRCLCEFASGMYLYQVWRLGRPATWKVAAATIIFAACVAAYVMFDIPDYTVIPVGSLCLIYALATRDTLLARIFSTPVILRLGLWSYSTYMVHYFVKDWITFVLVRDWIPAFVPMVAYPVLVLGASVVLYQYLEVPGRKTVRRLLVRAVPAAEGSA